ncbi:MAG: M23 family metallopeptidase [Muribaculaceae bacterium]|nr:M23 family metallopeptidase [Muribaculaceae bacterium]
MKRFPEAFAALTLFFLSFPLFSQTQENTDSAIDIFTRLAGVVSREESRPQDEDSIPVNLAEIVRAFYGDTKQIVKETDTSSILSYLTEVYRDHGFHESGNWAPGILDAEYTPYIGELPSYSIDEFFRPVDGPLTSYYGFRKRFNRFHRGIDIALSVGDTVRCALPGIVTKTGYDIGGFGRYVVVSHSGGLETLYGHLNGSSVSPGDHIKAGDPVGFGGNTGNSTGPHLHFETRYRGVAIDPLSWFNLLSGTEER